MRPLIEIWRSQCYVYRRNQHLCATGRNHAQTEDTQLSLNTTTATAVPSGIDRAAALPGFTEVTSDKLLEFVLSNLDDSKAEDVVQIDLRGRTSIGDFMVVCSGRSTRQVSAIAEKLTDSLKQELGRLSKIEGKGTGDWVLIDTGDIIIHVFRPEVRDFYQIEKMWQPSGDTIDTTPPTTA